MFAVQIPYGLKDGNLVHISEVSGGLSCGCRCPACASPLIAKKGNVRIHHFAHPGDAGPHASKCVSKESLLHLTGKLLLAKTLDKCRKSNLAPQFHWHCKICSDTHHIGFDWFHSSSLEESIEGRVPDLCLKNREGKVLAVLEVVVSHRPETEALAVYDRLGAMVLEFKLSRFDDLVRMENPEYLQPSLVRFCPRPFCSRCRGALNFEYLVVSDLNCRRCKSPMKVAWLEIGEDGVLLERDFTEEEILKAESAGARLELESGETLPWANVCPECRTRTTVGNIYRHKPAQGEPTRISQSVRESVGQWCLRCEELPATGIWETPDVWSECVAARLVDFHYRDGRRYREVYVVRKFTQAGKVLFFQLTNRKRELLGRFREENKKEIEKAVIDDIGLRGKEVHRAIHRTKWRSWAPHERFHPGQLDQFPWHLAWNDSRNEWEYPAEVPSPVLPRLARRGRLNSWKNLFKFAEKDPDPDFANFNPMKKEGECILCGKFTSKWWVYYGQTGQCKCLECYPNRAS